MANAPSGDEDLMLQLAIALSLAEEQGQAAAVSPAPEAQAMNAPAGPSMAPNPPHPTVASQPIAPPQQHALPNPPIQQLAFPNSSQPAMDIHSLVSTLQAALQGMGNVGQQQVQQQQQQHQFMPGMAAAAAQPSQVAAPTAPAATMAPRAAAPAPAPAPAMLAAPKAAELPSWAASLFTWYSMDPAAAPLPSSVELTADKFQQFLAAVSKALNVTVTAVGVAANTMVLKTTSRGDMQIIYSKDLASLLSLWLLRPQHGSKSKIHSLHDAYMLLPNPSTLQGSVGAAVTMFGRAVSQTAFVLLKDDEDDLYYEKGQYTSELLKGLKTPGVMHASFLEGMAQNCASTADAKVWEQLMRLVFTEFRSLGKIGSSSNELEPLLLMLDTFTAPARLQQCLASMLLREAHQLQHSNGKALEQAAVLAGFLQLSSLVDPQTLLVSRAVESRAKETYQQLKGYPNNYGEIEITNRILQGLFMRLQDAAHLLMKRLITLKDGNVTREVVLSWLSLVARLNTDRTRMGERGNVNLEEFTAGCSDGFMVNLVAACLRFCRPFVQGYLQSGGSQGSKFGDLFDKHLTPDYYTTQPHRLGDISNMSSLAGERGIAVAASTSSSGLVSCLVPELKQSGTPSFISDMFFLTQKLVHVGLLPAVFRYQRMRELLMQQFNASGEAAGDGSHGTGRPCLTEVSLLDHCTCVQLLEPTLVEDMVQFALVQLAWLWHLIQTGNTAAFKLIPECALGDVLTWLTFIIRGGQAVAVASKPMGLLMSSLVAILDSPSCVRSTLLLNKVTFLMLSMLAPQLDMGKRTQRGGLGRTIMRPGEAGLVAAVLSASSRQEQLLPALLRVYVQADFVVGLDVDKDQFDKFGMRNCIDMILGELWRDDNCRKNIVNLASSAASRDVDLFNDYISCALNSLIYLFKDSLDRLQDVHQIEASKLNSKAWAALHANERQQKEDFYRSQQQTCSGFMRMAVANLSWLNTLAAHPVVVKAFLRQPMAGRIAYAVVHFLDLLLGPRGAHLEVQRPEQYSFDAAALTESVCSLLLRLAPAPEFAAILREEPDLDVKILEQALAQLQANHQHMLASSLSSFLIALSLTAVQSPQPLQPPNHPAAAGTAARSEDADATALLPPAKRHRSNEEPRSHMSEASDGTTTTATTQGPDHAAAATAQNQAMSSLAVAPAAATAAVPGLLQLACVQLQLPETPALDLEYATQLEQLTIAPFDASAPGAYNRHFSHMADEAAGDTSAKMKRLTKEIRDLHSRTRLPCHAAAAIFVRHDAERIDKVRAMITGPEGTPYAGGCFVFDIFFPTGYPNVPPLMVLETTGQGRMRFNPNLYADGKVCLSLLGTWHGGHESEKWHPASSSLFQILLSIQGMILVKDPYFNEPNVETMRNSVEGSSHSRAYNAELHLGTIRWAMIDLLKRPPPGLEDIIRAHFQLLRHKVFATMKQWVEEAGAVDVALQCRMDVAACELYALLASL